jgi:hypothetical protein
LYSNLVTRPTGAAVRTEIEQLLAEHREWSLTIIDFSHVQLLDFSCADEIVAKLLLRYCASAAEADAEAAEGDPARRGYFLFRGIRDAHLDAIESVLERHGLALVAQLDGDVQLVGAVDAEERRTWEAICRLGRVASADLARAIGDAPGVTERVLARLFRRRLVMRLDDTYVAVGVAA